MIHPKFIRDSSQLVRNLCFFNIIIKIDFHIYTNENTKINWLNVYLDQAKNQIYPAYLFFDCLY